MFPYKKKNNFSFNFDVIILFINFTCFRKETFLIDFRFFSSK